MNHRAGLDRSQTLLFPERLEDYTAVRALAFKWQRIIWRCWQDHKPCDEPTYEAALQKNGSPLVALFDRVELGKSPFKNVTYYGAQSIHVQRHGEN
jgi:hypothetical protein